MEPFALIIFGVTSNLVRLKLIPALYDMESRGLLPSQTEIIGIARSFKNDDELKNHIHQILHVESGRHKDHVDEAVFERFQNRLHYFRGDFSDSAPYKELDSHLKSRRRHNKIFYLATYPNLYAGIFEQLHNSGLNSTSEGWLRLMIEKPFGSNLETAVKLDGTLHKFFSEDQIYRLDHYLGKETMQNILAFRFGNGLFRHLMNSDHVDHIQITVAEQFGLAGRGGYYDSVGAFKDVGQNHVLQMLVAATMDLPSGFSNEEITKERIKIVKNLIPMSDKIVLGQYQGYLSEENIPEDSQTETYFALKTEINSSTWSGVPIYLRSGKKLARSVAEIHIIFKTDHDRLFSHLENGMISNVLTYRIQPNEGIGLQILTKAPGHDWDLSVDHLRYCYSPSKSSPDAYEKLIYDAIRGNQTFFNDSAEIEAQWSFTDRLLEVKPTVHVYKPGSWGPKQADDLIQNDSRDWVESQVDFSA